MLIVVLFAAMACMGTTPNPGCEAEDLWLLSQVAPEDVPFFSSDLAVAVTADQDVVTYGGTVTLTATASGGKGPPYYYGWKLDNVFVDSNRESGNTDSYAIQLNTVGTHYLQGTVYDVDMNADFAGVYVEVVAEKPVVSLSVDRNYVTQGESVTVTATVTGGVPQYTYYWMLNGAAGYTEGGTTYTQVMDQAALRSVYCTVRDSIGTEPEEPASVQITVVEPEETCTSPAGTFVATYGDLTLAVSGSAVTGTYTYQDGSVTGTLNGHVVEGTWHEADAQAGYQDGNFRWTFNEEWDGFDGLWNYTGDGPLADTGWSWTGVRYGACAP
jgi:hypothetical protein